MFVPRRRALALSAIGFGVLLSAQLAFGQSQPFVSNSRLSPVRNNYTGFVGMKFTVGATPIYVTQLARYNITANSQSHLVKLVDAQTGIDIPNGSVSILNSGSGFFAYASLPNTVVLAANSSYLLLSQETAGGDTWYDYAQVFTTSAAAVSAAVYQDASGNYISVANSAGYGYVPLNFQYSTTVPPPTVTITSPTEGSTVTGATVTFSASAVAGPGLTIASVQFELGDSLGGNLLNFGPALTQAPYTLQDSTSSLYTGHHTLVAKATDSSGTVSTALADFYIGSPGGTLITGFSPTFVRNNYTGWVGLEFTVGATPVTVTSLGRLALPGNNGVHNLMLTSEPQDSNETFASVNITMTPGDGTTFQYAQLYAPLTLAANTTYVLVSEETSGGDTWYDYSPVSGVANGFSINAAVYYSATSGAYVTVPNTANYSYVPVNLIYTLPGGAVPGAVTMTSPANNSVFTSGPITFSASATPAAGLSVVSVHFVDSSYGSIGPLLTSPPYTIQVDSGLIDGAFRAVSAVMVDSGGNTTTSPQVSFTVAQDTIPFIATTNSIVADRTIAAQAGQYFGMQFTVGSTPLKVIRLGFYGCCSFDGVSLPLKLVDAATGVDVPGGAVTAGTPGTGWGYADLPAPIILQANKSYYLVGPLLYGQGYLLGPAVAAGAGTLNYPVYQPYQAANNTYVTATNLPGYSYALLNFEYESATPIPPTIAITSPSANSALSGTVAVALSASASIPLQVASLQFQVDSQNVGAPVIPSAQGAAYEVPLDTTTFSNGPHVLTAIATDSQGMQSTSAGVTVTVNNPAPTQMQTGLQAFVTSFTPTLLRNNYSGFVGFEFTVGLVPIQISSLGRVCVTGNNGSHTVKLVQASNGSDVAGGSVSVSLSGCTAGQFVYAPLGSPITLPIGSSYYLVDQETFGGDQWHDYGLLTVGSAGTVNGPVYSTGSQYVVVNAPGSSYVPLNFVFSAAAGGGNPGFAVTLSVGTRSSPPPVTATVTSTLSVTSVQFQIDGYPFGAPLTAAPYVLPTVPVPGLGTHVITAVAHDSSGDTASASTFASFTGLTDVVQFTGGTLRNNFSGWVGMRLTTGNSPYLVAGPLVPSQFSVGRLCSPGNSMVHLVKLVNASTGIDVPNAVAWINMAGCSAGSVIDAVISNAVLTANTSYYLLSQEVSGGDEWYDVSSAAPLAAAYIVVPPYLAEIGYYPIPTGANFTIDGPVYSAADGSLVFVPLPNYGFVGLSVGGDSTYVCQYGNVCGA